MKFYDMRDYAQGLKEVGLDREERREFIRSAQFQKNIYCVIMGAATVASAAHGGLVKDPSDFENAAGLLLSALAPLLAAYKERIHSKRIYNFIRETRNAIKSRKDGRDYNGNLEDACYTARSLV